jgi:hypothetical protein
MEKIFKGYSNGLGAILTLPQTFNRVLIGITVVGGLCLLMLFGAISYSFASGQENVTKGITSGIGAATRVATRGLV